ncbi:membrane protein [Vallitalea longa]|uniref:Membrane protein n=1 Tax=Vallitalea longa TaxID=2936439 RepID=A0A9W6DDG5_9FIRM|nr:DMT family transporter [Vallitalea longa]GKX28801.1 membrane protein [Vallitalea longa]
MQRNYKIAILWAILAATLYSFSSPFSKILLNKIPPTMMAALLYLGAGIGMTIFGAFSRTSNARTNELSLTKDELPYIVSMVVLDIIAPVLLMIGLNTATPENVSLLNNFEIVATSLIALLIFKETITKRLWLSIVLISISSILLSIEDMNSFSFSLGSILVLLACICWGFENNCTRKLSQKDPLQIVIIKGFGSGLGSLIIALVIKEKVTDIKYIAAALVLGFFAYGLSIFFYVHAQRSLGAAKTSAYYAVAPFIGVVLSFIIFRQPPKINFIIALPIMILGTYLTTTDNLHAEE